MTSLPTCSGATDSFSKLDSFHLRSTSEKVVIFCSPVKGCQDWSLEKLVVFVSLNLNWRDFWKTKLTVF